MSLKKYNSRVFLNPETSHYTGSIVCADFEDVINLGRHLERYSFVEISDCHGKARIHTDSNLPKEEFIKKLDLLIQELTNFKTHMQEN